MENMITLPSDIDDYVDAPIDFFDHLIDVLPKEVCHYTRKEVALEEILSKKRILLGGLANTNDPREYKNRFYFHLEWGKMNGVTTWGENLEENRIKELRVFCSTCHNNPSWDFMYPNFQYKDHSMFGVSQASMWAHYAGKHTGICILFDAEKLDQNIKEELKNKNCEVKHGFIKYNLEKAAGMIITDDGEFSGYEKDEKFRKSIMKHYDDNFLYKTPDWKSEHEFRWIIQYRELSDLYVSIENAIKAVIVGADFPRVYESSLKALCEKLGVSAGRINWNAGRPFINRYEIYDATKQL